MGQLSLPPSNASNGNVRGQATLQAKGLIYEMLAAAGVETITFYHRDNCRNLWHQADAG